VEGYYEARAPEYDDWWLGTGRFTVRARPGWREAVDALVETISALPPGRTLDVACGTGFLTQHLRGAVVGLDQSRSMLELARRRVPKATFVEGDALALPFPNGVFNRVLTAHFYGHLDEEARQAFLAEARRVGRELVVVDSAMREGVEPESMQERILNDGSRWEVLKRYFEPEQLVEELGGGRVLQADGWFVVAASP
jgi:demethylmenaquinone methyltransferase/2-methoxy-6-polyprenyl-1,4-benzoquinol methylase